MKKVLIASIVVMMCYYAAYADDWPQYRADASRSGRSAESLPEDLSLRWVHRSFSPPLPAWKGKDTRMPFDHARQVAVAGGRLFYGDNADCAVHALDAASGRALWRFITDGPVRFAPAAWRDRVFAVSDDGFLYCLDAGSGDLVWKKRGGPDSSRIIGNDRIVSRWPARGGVTVKDDVVYFGAGIWPSEGIYLYALDPATGETLWLNETAGGMVMDKPHPTAYAKSGVSAQGYLVAYDDRLIVPTGRGVPAAFDRTTGDFLWFHHQKYREYGGSRVHVAGGILMVDAGNDRQTVLSSGTARGFFDPLGGERIARDTLPSIAAASYPGSIVFAEAGAVHDIPSDNAVVSHTIVDGNGKDRTDSVIHQPGRSIAIPGFTEGCELITAGSQIIVGSPDGRVFVVDHEDREVVWSASVDGAPLGLAVADGRLYVSTDRGILYCYDGTGAASPALFSPVPVNDPYPENGRYADAAREIVNVSGIADGYCVDLGCGDGALAYELARITNMHIIAVDGDPQNVAEARERIMSAGLYGTRVTVIEADPAHTDLPEYFANIVVSRDGVDGNAVSDFREEASRLQRPWGGIVSIGTPGKIAADVRGPLEEAGVWTHQYHDPANTITSEEGRLSSALGMLWFRDDDFDVPSRHGRGVAPLFSGGLLFVEGIDAVRAIDAYNGRTVWEVPFPDIQKPYDAEHLVGTAVTQGNMCIDDGRLYIRTVGVQADGDYWARSCVVLDAASGRKLAEYRVPDDAAADDGSRYWGYIAVEDGVLYGSVVDTGHVVRHAYRESDMNQLFSESTVFFALDAVTGDHLWTYRAANSIRHNAIAIGNGRVYLIDRALATADRLRNPHRGGETPVHETGKLVALNCRTGDVVWESEDDVYGTLLALSTEYNKLVMTYQFTRFRQSSEVGGRMSLYDTATGERVWDIATGIEKGIDYPYSSRPLVNGDTIYMEPYAWDLMTGEKREFTLKRSYACGIVSGAQNMLLYRSATLGYFNLEEGIETENYGGFRPGCWINAIPAGGLVLVPDATDRCNCSYLNKASVALMPLYQ